MAKTRKIILIIVIILLIIAAALFAFCRFTPKGNEWQNSIYAYWNTQYANAKASIIHLYRDDPLQTMKDLKLYTELPLSELKRKSFVWESKSEGILPTTINGRIYDKLVITNDQSDKVREFFERSGFGLQFFDVDLNTYAGISGYRKDDTACLVKIGPLKDDNNELIAEDKLNFEIFCGRLAQ
ncbi:MAG: hypothetical protein PHG23_01190 [Candidatus Pacebacteria bacterium]|nr:hypothetical protein [Candidatus Paceibacterota bacterium]